MNNTGDIRYQELAATIVAQACEDYCMSQRVINSKYSTEEELKEAFEMNNDCLDFFYSDRFRLFSNFEMPIEDLIERLDYLAENDEREFIRFYIPKQEIGEGDDNYYSEEYE